jgi:hypothetical protein
MHQPVPQIVHKSAQILKFPQISQNSVVSELTVASSIQVHSCLPFSRFNILVCYRCLAARLIKLDHARSPRTPWIALGVRHPREQRVLNLELCN